MNVCRSTAKYFLAIFLISVTLLLTGCSSTMSNAKNTPQPSTVPGLSADESFDPVELKDDGLSFPQAEAVTPVIRETDDNSAANSSQNNDLKMQNRTVEGFRVQIFATKDIEVATLQKKEAEYEFADDGIAVYIEFDSPLYKVRVGDCLDRDAAEQLRARIKDLGFPSAFITRTRVNTVPVLPDFSAPESPEVLPRNN